MTKKNFWLTALVIAIIVIIDQVSKALIEVNLSESDKITLIPNFFYISLVYNKGAAWGSLSDNTLVLMLISIAASLAGLYFCVKNDFKTRSSKNHTLSSQNLTHTLSSSTTEVNISCCSHFNDYFN